MFFSSFYLNKSVVSSSSSSSWGRVRDGRDNRNGKPFELFILLLIFFGWGGGSMLCVCESAHEFKRRQKPWQLLSSFQDKKTYKKNQIVYLLETEPGRARFWRENRESGCFWKFQPNPATYSSGLPKIETKQRNLVFFWKIN